MLTARQIRDQKLQVREERTIDELTVIGPNQTLPTLAAADGQVQPLGGNPIPGDSNGSAVGEPVAISQGLVQQLRGNARTTADRALLQRLEQQLRVIANRRGVLVFQGDGTNAIDDPNDAANSGDNRAYQDYDRQLVITGNPSTAGEGALYRHVPGGIGVPEQFIPVAMEIAASADDFAPEQGRVYNLRARATYRMVVTSIFIKEEGEAGTYVDTDAATQATSGSLTVTLNTAIGAVVEIGSAFTMTATATDGTAFTFEVGGRRI
ncbi:MAG: hypothetical protein AAF959_11325 [Cyanobacteria bacterium P01_D01_bin.56]